MALHTEPTEQWKQVVIPARRESASSAASLNGDKSGAVTLGKAADADKGGLWGEDGFTFGDLVDLVNPLQHIPLVSTAYRAITGDEIAPAARMAGGALLGGVVGLVASGINAAIEEGTGKDAGEHVLAMFGGISSDETPVPATTLLSSADPVTRLSEEKKDEEEDALSGEPDEAEPSKSFTLNATEPVENDDRAAYLLGSLEQATQRYQQAAMADRLQDIAQGMDITG